LCHFHIRRQYGRQPAELRYDQQNAALIPPILFFTEYFSQRLFNTRCLALALLKLFSQQKDRGPRTAAGPQTVVSLTCVCVPTTALGITQMNLSLSCEWVSLCESVGPCAANRLCTLRLGIHF
jgi:hypothetical protein